MRASSSGLWLLWCGAIFGAVATASCGSGAGPEPGAGSSPALLRQVRVPRQEPGDYDARTADAPASRRVARMRGALEELRRAGLVSAGDEPRVDDRLGVPTFVRPGGSAENRPRAQLQGPAGAGSTSHEAAARSHLRRLAPLYGVTDEDVAQARLVSVHDTGKGAIIVKLRQRVGGVEVYQHEVNVVMDREQGLVALTGFLRGDGEGNGAAGLVAADRFSLGAPGAALAALRDLTGVALDASVLEIEPAPADPFTRFRFTAAAAQELGVTLRSPLRVRKVYFASGDALRAAYHVEVVLKDKVSGAKSAHGYVVSAADGALLLRSDLALGFTYRVWADGNDAPLGTPNDPSTYYPFPAGQPSTWIPPYIAPTLHSLDAGPIRTGDPWLPPGATEADGNNVHVYADGDGTGTPTFRATVSSPGVFDYTYDPSLAPTASSAQRAAAIVQAFYTCNWLHDWFYDAGFDEASGNGQEDNRGRGGLSGDKLLVELEETKFENNAWALAMSDGVHPRIEVSANFASGKAGAIDSWMITHEWGHTMAGRLVGDGGGFSTNHTLGLSEGWADFIALLVYVRDPGVDLRGAFATGAPFATQAYKCLRRYPASVDFAIDPLTFRNIENGQALPTGAPVCNLAKKDTSNSDPHMTGEVWATMLWECYVALLQESRGESPRMGFAEARDRMKRYLVASLKATPVQPTLIEARDALLAVVFAEDPRDGVLFQRAFARRGAGAGASGPIRYNAANAGVVESFSTAGYVEDEDVAVTEDPQNCDQDGEVSNNEVGYLHVTVRNTGGTALSRLVGTVSTNDFHVTFPAGMALQFPTIAPYGKGTATIRFALQGATGIEDVAFDLALTDPDLAGGATSLEVIRRLNRKVVPASSTVDTMETPIDVWQTELLGLGQDAQGFGWTSDWYGARWRRRTYPEGPSVTNTTWTSRDPPGLPFYFRCNGADFRLSSPAVSVSGSEDFTLSFYHRYSFITLEPSLDGGVVELSTDGGQTWDDTAWWTASGSGPAYVDRLLSGPTDVSEAPRTNLNPLQGRWAYAGKSPNYPAFQQETINFGRNLAGQSVKVRFRLGSYYGGGGFPGWDVDSIRFGGITNTPFPAERVGTTCPQPSLRIVREPADVTVTAGASATFSVEVAASGGAPSYQWFVRTRDGATRALSGETGATLRIAPATAGDSGNGYFVRVWAGAATVESRVAQLTVTQPAPPAIVTQPQTRNVSEGGTVTFTVVATGAGPLHYQWKKDGVPVGTDSPSYTIPAVKMGDSGSVTVTVTNADGSATSNPASLIVMAVPPVITAQPQGRSVRVGQSVTFSVTATGTAPLRYQWKRNGADVGGNSATFTLSSVKTSDAATYTVMVFNSVGTVTSNGAQLTVNR